MSGGTDAALLNAELDKSSVCANENEPQNVNGPVVVRLTTPASLVESAQKTAVLWLRTLVPSTYLPGSQSRTQKTARFQFIICTGYSLYAHYRDRARLFIISVPMRTVPDFAVGS